MDKVKTDAEKVQESLDLIFQYGGFDGGHHKQWVLDQLVRILTGTEEAYKHWVHLFEYEDADDDEKESKTTDSETVEDHDDEEDDYDYDEEEDDDKDYEWDTGIAP